MITEPERIKAYITALIQSGAVKVASDGDHLFELRNGTKSCVYVDHGEVLCQPDTLRPYIGALAERIHDGFLTEQTILVNVDSKSSPHTVGALASLLRLRQIVVSPSATSLAEKGPNLAVRLPKEAKAGDILVIVDDVFTQGDTTAVNAVSLVRHAIAARTGEAKQETHLVVGLLRGDEKRSVQQLRNSGITLHWLTTLGAVLGRVWPGLTHSQQSILIHGGFDCSRLR